MKLILNSVGLLALGATAAFAELIPVSVEPIKFRDATLEVAGVDGSKRYSPSDLETLGTYTMTTVTPWRDAPADFVGVRLRDVLAASGIDDAQTIRVVAENDYAIEMNQDAWMELDALIATRVDGKAHTRRARGPLQIVFSMASHPETGKENYERYWVWLAASIEVVK